VLPTSVLSTLSKTVNAALKAAGIQIYLIPATKQIHGSQVSLDSSALIISLKKPGYRAGLNDTGMVLQLGGVSINAIASPGYVAPSISTSPSAGSVTTSSPTNNSVPPLTNPTFPGSSSQQMPSTAPAPVLAANPLNLPGALSSWWVFGGILLTMLAALALGMWPARALVAGAGCNLEEE
jgi:hypothetical protein